MLKLISLFWDVLDNLSGIEKSASFEFGVNQVPVNKHIENTVTPRNELCLNTELLAQFFRQTDGFWLIVSFSTITNLNLHDLSPSCSAQQ